MRLTKELRRDIRDQIVKMKVDPLRRKWMEDTRFTTLAYINQVHEKYVKWIKVAPEGYLYKVKSISVRFWENKESDNYVSIDFEQPIVVLAGWATGWGRAEIILSVNQNDWNREFKKHKDDARAIENYKYELESELTSVLAGVTTHKRLLETFPEVKDFINLEKLEFFPPAVSTDRLKGLMKLGDEFFK